MIRPLFRSACMLSLALVVPILLLRPLPYDNSSLEALLMPPQHCDAPCFMGLHPGFTTIAEAQQRLQVHPWVDRVTLVAYPLDQPLSNENGWISFTWSAAHPALIDARTPGRVDFRQHFGSSVVDSIRIRTNIRMPALEQWLGPPSGEVYSQYSDKLSYGISYRSTPLQTMMGLSVLINCPATLLDYWYSPTEIRLTTWVGMDAAPVSLNQIMRAC